MSDPKSFLSDDDPYRARIENLERIVKALCTSPRSGYTGMNAAEVFGAAQQLVSDGASWHDLATAGPTVTASVGPTGKILIIAHSRAQIFADSGGTASASIGVCVDGATTPASGSDIGTFDSLGGMQPSSALEASLSVVRLHAGLSPDATHTFKIRYLAEGVGIGAGSWFDNRTIVAIPL